jgi:uncharacterized protein YidB (DUF937 family)
MQRDLDRAQDLKFTDERDPVQGLNGNKSKGRTIMASSRMLALLGLLAVAGYQNRDRLSEMLRNATGGGAGAGPDSPASQTSKGGGLGEVLGGLFGTTGSSGDLRGGLGDLIDQFTGAGQEGKAKSWVEAGSNQALEQTDLERALGEDTIESLTNQTGLSRDELLSRLQSVLPDAVDKLTPEGHIPTETELERWASGRR